MSRSKVGYKFKPAHAELPVAWRKLKLFRRLMMSELWRMSDSGELKTDFDLLVRDLDIGDKGDRVAAVKAVQWLREEGFITVAPGLVRLHEEPMKVRCECVVIAEVPSIAITTQAKSPESFKVDLTDQRELDQEERARAHEAPPVTKPQELIEFRRPLPPEPEYLPEPTPNLEAQKRALAERIFTYLKAQGKKASGATPKPDMRQAMELAAWCLSREAQEDWRLDSTELAKRVCDGLVASERAQKAGYPLAWAAKNPLEFLGTAPGAPRAQGGSVRPQWEPPSWYAEGERVRAAAEQVEIDAAIRETLSNDETIESARSVVANLLRKTQPHSDAE